MGLLNSAPSRKPSRSPWPACYPLAITATLRRRIPVRSPWKQVTLRYKIKIR